MAAWLGLAGALGAALIAGVFTLLGHGSGIGAGEPPPGGPSAVVPGGAGTGDNTSAGPTSPGAGVPTSVINTWDPDSQSFVGLWKFPRPDSNAGRVSGPSEGESIRVVCQARSGRITTATPFRGRQTASRVWDRLPDGYYISDIYTDLPKVSGPRPPSGLPAC